MTLEQQEDPMQRGEVDPHESDCPCFGDTNSDGERVIHDKKCRNCECAKQRGKREPFGSCVCTHKYSEHGDHSPRLGFSCEVKGCRCEDFEERGDIGSTELNHDDLCRLGRVFNEHCRVDTRDERIRQWLHNKIAGVTASIASFSPL